MSHFSLNRIWNFCFHTHTVQNGCCFICMGRKHCSSFMHPEYITTIQKSNYGQQSKKDLADFFASTSSRILFIVCSGILLLWSLVTIILRVSRLLLLLLFEYFYCLRVVSSTTWKTYRLYNVYYKPVLSLPTKATVLSNIEHSFR